MRDDKLFLFFYFCIQFSSQQMHHIESFFNNASFLSQVNTQLKSLAKLIKKLQFMRVQTVFISLQTLIFANQKFVQNQSKVQPFVFLLFNQKITQIIQNSLAYTTMSLSKTQVVDLSDLMSFLTKIVAQSCAIMHETAYGIMMKEGNDPVTEIDFKIQYKIVNGLQKTFPQIKIVGQEDLKLMNKISSPTQTSTSAQLKQDIKIALPSQLFDLGTVVASELCIWIDPLDCTRGFVGNKKHECTINVGVTYKQTPIIGVIGQPYKKKSAYADNENCQYFYNPTVTIGCINSLIPSSFQLQVEANSWKGITFSQNRFQPSLDIKSSQNQGKVGEFQKNSPKIAISSRRSSSTQDKLIKHLGAQQVFTGGAGHKILLVIRGQIEAMMLIEVETSWWDSCAGQAIMKSMGGFFIQPDLNSISYNCDSQSYSNKIGFLCVSNPQLYHQIYSFISKISDQNIKNQGEKLLKNQ